MTSEQFLGILTLMISLAFFACATWKRDHELYKKAIKEMSPLLGEGRIHMYYQVLAAFGAIVGALAVLGYR